MNFISYYLKLINPLIDEKIIHLLIICNISGLITPIAPKIVN